MTGSASSAALDRSHEVLLGVFGRPRTQLVAGRGALVVDADGREYVDLLGGIAVNALGHGHPALVEAITAAASMVHVSNFFVTPAQVELAARLLDLAGAPDGSRVFFCNSGAEAIEAVLKASRRTGRTGVVALEGAFHGRTTGALALTHKAAYREPFAPLVGDITFVPPNDVDALVAAVDDTTALVIMEPTQGEAGVRPLTDEYLRAARDVTARAGALLAFDEIQTGIGRTGRWFDHERAGVRPDLMTLAKGLAGGVPIGAVVTYGPTASQLLGPGQHGTTFGGNPLACAAALAVLRAVEGEGLLGHARDLGARLRAGVLALGHPRVTGVRGDGLLVAVALADDGAPALAQALEDAGFVVNPVAPDAIRLAPPLVLTTEQANAFLAALPAALDVSAPTADHQPDGGAHTPARTTDRKGDA